MFIEIYLIKYTIIKHQLRFARKMKLELGMKERSAWTVGEGTKFTNKMNAETLGKEFSSTWKEPGSPKWGCPER